MNKILLTLTALICMNAHSKMVEMKFDYVQEQENGQPIIRINPNEATEYVKQRVRADFYINREEYIKKEVEDLKKSVFGKVNLEKLNESFQRFNKDGSLLYFSISKKETREYRRPDFCPMYKVFFLSRELPTVEFLLLFYTSEKLLDFYSLTKTMDKVIKQLKEVHFLSTLKHLYEQGVLYN